MLFRPRHVLTHVLPLILWAGVIYVLSDQPDLRSPFATTLDLVLRKAAHLGEYALLALLVVRMIRLRLGRSMRLIVLTLIVCALYAITDEVHQVFVPGRVGAIADVGIDSIGSFIAAALYVIRLPKIQGRQINTAHV